MTPGLGIPCSILLSYGREPSALYGSAAGRGKLARRPLLLALAAGRVAEAAFGADPVLAEDLAIAAVEGPSLLRLADGRRLRLSGIVVPGELSPAADGEARARAATSRLEALLARGSLAIEIHGQDRLGRLAALVRTGDGRTVQEILLHEGLAWAFCDGLPEPLGRAFLAAEAETGEAAKLRLLPQGSLRSAV